MKLRKKVRRLGQEIRTLWIRTDNTLTALGDVNERIEALNEAVSLKGEVFQRIRETKQRVYELDEQATKMLKWIETIQSTISDINGSIRALDDIVTMTRAELLDRMRGVDVRMNQMERQYRSDQSSYQNLYHKMLGVEEGLERVTDAVQERLNSLTERIDFLQIPINGNLEEEIDGEEVPSAEQLNQMMMDVYALTQSMTFRRIVEGNLTDRIEKLEAKVEELMEVKHE